MRKVVCLCEMWGFVLLLTLLLSGVIGLPPVMIKQPVESEILFKVSPTGDKHVFEVPCEAYGDPMPEYRWIKDGKDFNVMDQIDRISKKSDSGSLKFMLPREEDEGEYYCLAENKDGIARSNTFRLKKAYLENFVNDTVKTIEAHEGASLKLECKAPNGYPVPSIFWMIQTVHGAIKSVDNTRVTLDPTGNLWFSSVTRDDASKDSHYVCSAGSTFANEYKLGNRITLKVIPRSTKSWKGHPPTLQHASSPNIVVLRGKKVEIFCIYEGTPQPSIAWSKDGKPVEKSERVGAVMENFGKSLKIKNADVVDEGKYKCEASSESGDTQTSNFNLRVESPPQFTVEPQSKNITERESFEVECVVGGVPEAKVEWFFNGKPIEMEKQSRREIMGTKLVVKSAEESDRGNYACSASNVHGFASRNVFVNVQSSTE